MALDETDWKILAALQDDARQSFTALGDTVGLSSPAVTERVRKLEAVGIIQKYAAQLNLAALGITIQAFVNLTTSPQNYSRIHTLVGQTPAFLECHHLTGDASFIIRVVADSLPHLEALLEKLSRYGTTQTALVLSTPLLQKAITPDIVESC